MNQIEVAERIIEQNGKCSDIVCEDCPAYPIQLKVYLRSCNEIWGADDDKKCKDWFKNWLKENKKQENVMNDKIQMTEEQAREYDKKRGAFTCEICGKTPCKAGEEDCDYQFLKKNGYIIKSELQQKVEEAEEMIRVIEQNTEPNEFFRLSEIQMIKIKNVLSVLKVNHPEFNGK